MEQNEVWKNVGVIKGMDFSDTYQVSSLGNVRSLDRAIPKSNGSYQNLKSKPIKTWISIHGYERIALNKGDRTYHTSIHYLVAVAFIPNPEGKKFINHKLGNKLLNSVDDIEWATSSENQLHAYKTGLKHAKRGEDMYNHVLNYCRVLLIKKLKGIKKAKELAILFNVEYKNVHQIQANKRWPHVQV